MPLTPAPKQGGRIQSDFTEDITHTHSGDEHSRVQQNSQKLTLSGSVHLELQ